MLVETPCLSQEGKTVYHITSCKTGVPRREVLLSVLVWEPSGLTPARLHPLPRARGGLGQGQELGQGQGLGKWQGQGQELRQRQELGQGQGLGKGQELDQGQGQGQDGGRLGAVPAARAGPGRRREGRTQP